MRMFQDAGGCGCRRVPAIKATSPRRRQRIANNLTTSIISLTLSSYWFTLAPKTPHREPGSKKEGDNSGRDRFRSARRSRAALQSVLHQADRRIARRAVEEPIFPDRGARAL